MTSRGKALARTVEADRLDTDERVRALRLQCLAWRQLALIALVDPEFGRQRAQWLFMNTVPFTNAVAVERFIAETEGLAAESGIKAGVFTSRRADGANAP